MVRDLKPENIVLDSDFHAKLTDFGLSKEGIADNMITKSFCGSLAYLAPEIIKKNGHGKSLDWYLVGVLLYEMLTGTPPYYSKIRDQLFYNITSGILRFPAHVSQNAKSLVTMLLNRDPKLRLGAGKKDAKDIKNHPFFDGISWDDIYNKRISLPKTMVPLKPAVELKFTKMPQIIDSPEENGPTKIDDWSYFE